GGGARSDGHRPRPSRWLRERRVGARRLRHCGSQGAAQGRPIGGLRGTYISNSIEARDVASLVHMQTNLRRHQQEGPHVIVRGEGCRVFDDAGRDYIDTIAGLWCASLGFGSERLAKVAYEQMRKLGYYHLYRPRSDEAAVQARPRAVRRAAAKGLSREEAKPRLLLSLAPPLERAGDRARRDAAQDRAGADGTR